MSKRKLPPRDPRTQPSVATLFAKVATNPNGPNCPNGPNAPLPRAAQQAVLAAPSATAAEDRLAALSPAVEGPLDLPAELRGANFDTDADEAEEMEEVQHNQTHTRSPAGSTKKRKRKPNVQAKVDAAAAKRTAIATDVARGPLPVKRHRGEGPFAPQLMPVGLFDSDRPGERWAAHPDYAPSEMLVSNYGVVRKLGRHAGVGEYEYCALGSLQPNGYLLVGTGSKNRSVHSLVCEAFHGPKPSKAHTVDHKDRDRSNNYASNLRWATKKEQLDNRETPRALSTGVPVLARKVGSAYDAEWTWYESATAAGKALGVFACNISRNCRGEKKTVGGYVFRHGPPLEDQGDLPAEWVETPDGPLWVPAEAWKLNPESGGRTRVSTRGRVQTKTPAGEHWTPRRTPRAAAGDVYAKVNGTKVHLVVWRTFCPDDPTSNGESIDHIDRDTSNNALYNLRRATPSEQCYNQDRMLADDQARSRKPVLAWKDGASRETAERFVGQNAAARALNTRFETTKFLQCCIWQAANAKKGPGKHNGWRFAFVPETKEEVAAREGQRQRVLAAIAALRAAASSASRSTSAPPSPTRSVDAAAASE